MKKTYYGILSVLLAVAMLACAVLPAYAAREEEYLADLRLVYASDYDEAADILAGSEFSDYYLLDENLNEDTGKSGVYLAYKITTDIEEAITDLSVMQMDGGYRLASYQEMIRESYAEYLESGEIYQEAITYFAGAYDAGDFLAKSAYRQLNFYTVETVGIKEIPPFEGELLGDIFYDGIDTADLATMFMEGNSYALENIRSLLAMGVSYNADGKAYLEKVVDTAAAMTADSKVYDNKGYDVIAAVVSEAIVHYRVLFKELAIYEPELDYTDTELTETEIKYLEAKLVADLLRDVAYLGGKTLYEFCLTYEKDEDDYTSLYPLIAALNAGQTAMAKVGHYADVVRYSMPIMGTEEIDAELDRLEEIYEDEPFNVYEGVDRTIYDGAFAMTNEAYRADASTGTGLASLLYSGPHLTFRIMGGVGAAFLIGGCVSRYFDVASHKAAFQTLLDSSQTAIQNAVDGVATAASSSTSLYATNADMVNSLFSTFFRHKVNTVTSFSDRLALLENAAKQAGNPFHISSTDVTAINDLSRQVADAKAGATPVATSAPLTMGTATLFAVGGALMLMSAFSLVGGLIEYYSPAYAAVPRAMVDVIDTKDGDRYIKYDVVYEAEPEDDGAYAPGDLNAFEGYRWNALYYTKSYEAGKPLLADEFKVSNRSNKPSDGYMPVHRFGETVCHDLNKYTYDDDTSIYLSVKQSEHQKKAVADVPEVVGSVFGTGFLVLAGGVGVIVGIGGTVATQVLVGKKRSKVGTEEDPTDDK